MKLIKEKCIYVLEALFQGHQIRIPNSEYGDITVALADDNHLCMKMIAHNEDGSEREWWTHNIDDSLKTFIDMCNTLTDDELFIIGANTVLTSIKRERIR